MHFFVFKQHIIQVLSRLSFPYFDFISFSSIVHTHFMFACIFICHLLRSRHNILYHHITHISCNFWTFHLTPIFTYVIQKSPEVEEPAKPDGAGHTTPHPSDVLDMPVDPNEPTYCVCQQVSYGEMIGCDNTEVCLVVDSSIYIIDMY